MTKVHPNASRESASASASATSESERDQRPNPPRVLTVWKKSLLPNCNGFTVFDTKGNLVFRVDNYIAANKYHIVLMDAAGTPLLTIRRKRLSLGDTCLVFEGEDSGKLLFTARKHVNILNSKCLAHVFSSSSPSISKKEIAYEMEGSYAQRCCTFYNKNRRKVAEMKMKEAVPGSGLAFGSDIFRLIVQPQMDTTLSMAFVILLDHMYGSHSSSR